MHEHTFRYTDKADFLRQLEEMSEKLQEMQPYDRVRASYPNIRTAAAFSMRLKRFKGTFPKEMGPGGKRIIKMTVTRELDAYLRA